MAECNPTPPARKILSPASYTLTLTRTLNLKPLMARVSRMASVQPDCQSPDGRVQLGDEPFDGQSTPDGKTPDGMMAENNLHTHSWSEHDPLMA